MSTEKNLVFQGNRLNKVSNSDYYRKATVKESRAYIHGPCADCMSLNFDTKTYLRILK